jgi:hypothetical protein
MPPTDLPESWNLEAEDGEVADIHADADGLAFHRFSAGRILDHVAELACRTGAVVIPRFPYHPNPVATGSVTASDEPCVCCGQERGWVYTGPVYAADAPDTGICPYCIAFGTAAEHYDAFFTDGIEGDGDVPQDVVTAVLRRTPGFVA